MNKSNGYKLIQGKQDIFGAIACICSVLAWIFYRQNGVNEFSPVLSKDTIVWLAAGVICCLAALLTHIRVLRFAAYLILLYAFLSFTNAQITYIANVFVSIDGNTFSAGFLMTVVCFVLAFVLALLSGITDKKKGQKEVPGNEAEEV